MGNSPRRKTVRAEQLERRLDEMEAEMAAKIINIVGNFYVKTIAPRFDWIEMPWYKRLWIRLEQTWAAFKHDRQARKDPGYIRKGTRVTTTEVGAKQFEGHHQFGTVKKVKDGHVFVQIDDQQSIQEYSPSVWVSVNKPPEPEEAPPAPVPAKPFGKGARS